MQVGSRLLDQSTECEARNDLRCRGNRHPDEVGTAVDDRRNKAVAKKAEIRILRFVVHDPHQILRRIDRVTPKLIIDDGQSGREIDRGHDLQPLIDHEQTGTIGIGIVKLFTPQGVFSQLNPIDQIPKPIERIRHLSIVLTAAWPRLPRLTPLQLALLGHQLLVHLCRIAPGQYGVQ